MFVLFFKVWFYFVFLVVGGFVTVPGFCLFFETELKVRWVGSRRRIWKDLGEKNVIKIYSNLKFFKIIKYLKEKRNIGIPTWIFHNYHKAQAKMSWNYLTVKHIFLKTINI